LTPERLFERHWALTLLRHTLDRLERETMVQGKHALFQWLKPALSGETADLSYTQISAALGVAKATVRVAAHRLRRRLGTLIREPDQIEEETTALSRAPGPGPQPPSDQRPFTERSWRDGNRSGCHGSTARPTRGTPRGRAPPGQKTTRLE